MESGMTTSTTSIGSLVRDIYALVKDGRDIDEGQLESFGKGMAGLLKDRLSTTKKDSKGKLYLSQMGKPDRQIWYEYHGMPKESLKAHTLLKFLIGDVWEAVLLFLAKASGHKVEGEQERIEVEGVTGRQDAIIDGVRVDVKSASTYAYQKFKDGKVASDDPFGYIQQLASYNAVNPTERVAFLAGDKQNGHICVDLHESSAMPDAAARIRHVKEMVEGSEPARCYQPKPFGKSGNMMLPIGCQYCAFKEHCWRDSNGGKGLRTFIYSDGPVFLTDVVNEPKVFEVKKDGN